MSRLAMASARSSTALPWSTASWRSPTAGWNRHQGVVATASGAARSAPTTKSTHTAATWQPLCLPRRRERAHAPLAGSVSRRRARASAPRPQAGAACPQAYRASPQASAASPQASGACDSRSAACAQACAPCGARLFCWRMRRRGRRASHESLCAGWRTSRRRLCSSPASLRRAQARLQRLCASRRALHARCGACRQCSFCSPPSGRGGLVSR
jgi:hypothetical protein